MMNIEAKIDEISFTVLGQTLSFANQVVFFQSKSIFDVIVILTTGHSIDMVIVGTDRVTANGDVANKIRTFNVAILANYFKIPFYVACPASTIDLNSVTGDEIVIEERAPEEVTAFGERRTAPIDIKVRNPAFDVTPANLVTGIITERTILRAPYAESIRQTYGTP